VVCIELTNFNIKNAVSLYPISCSLSSIYVLIYDRNKSHNLLCYLWDVLFTYLSLYFNRWGITWDNKTWRKGPMFLTEN